MVLSKQHRINRGEDFRRILRRGRRISNAAGVFVALPAERPRFGFIVSKAVGNAVERNRAKRHLRAAARSTLGQEIGAEIVVKASRDVLSYSVDELAGLLEEVARLATAR